MSKKQTMRAVCLLARVPRDPNPSEPNHVWSPLQIAEYVMYFKLFDVLT